MKTFQGRVVTPGCAQAEALVTHLSLIHISEPTRH